MSRGEEVPGPPNQHITGVQTEENGRGCKKMKSRGKGEGCQREGREQVLVRKGEHERWMEGAGWCSACRSPGMGWFLFERARCSGLRVEFALLSKGKRQSCWCLQHSWAWWAALDTACNATLSWVPSVLCSNEETWWVQSQVVIVLHGRWASSFSSQPF